MPELRHRMRQLMNELAYQYRLQFRLKELLEHFFLTIQAVKNGRDSGNSIEHSDVKIIALRFICSLTLIRAVQLLILTLIPSLSLAWRMLLWDQMLFLGADHSLNFVYVLYGFFGSTVYYWIHYLDRNGLNRQTTVELIRQSLTPDGDQNRDHLMRISPKKLQNLFTRLVYGLTCFVVFWVNIPFYYITQVIQYIVVNPSLLTTASGLLYVTATVVNVLPLIVFYYLLLALYILGVVMLTLFTYIVFNRIRRISRLLRPAKITSYRVLRFARLHTEILLDICEANRLFGSYLLLVTIMSTPSSSYLCMLVLTRQLPPLVLIHHVNLMAYTWLYTFAIHMLAAQYTHRIHSCAKPLLHLCARQASPDVRSNGRGFSLETSMKLSIYVAKFHIYRARRYGFTFAIFGLISLGSFVKFVYIYSRLLMFSFGIRQ